MADERQILAGIEAAAWPNREASRVVEAGGITWHVQQMGAGPPCLLLHGTGASTHSWRDFAPALSTRFTIIAPDLPGHGFTETPRYPGMSLPGMTRLLDALLAALGVKPSLAVGHSAGAAILLSMAAACTLTSSLIVGLNGALLPFGGVGRHLFPTLAKLAFLNPVTPRIFAWRAKDRPAVERVIAGTGSKIDAAGIDQYAHLFRDPRHVEATLTMMANWDLVPLERDLAGVKTKVLLVTSSEDRSIPPEDAFRVRDLMPNAEVVYLRGLGHLAHEEDPKKITELILAQAEALALLPPSGV